MPDLDGHDLASAANAQMPIPTTTTTISVTAIQTNGRNVREMPVRRPDNAGPAATSAPSTSWPDADVSYPEQLRLGSLRVSTSNKRQKLNRRQAAGAGVGNVNAGCMYSHSSLPLLVRLTVYTSNVLKMWARARASTTSIDNNNRSIMHRRRQ